MTDVEDADRLRQRFLAAVWASVRGLSEGNVGATPAAARAISAGADPADVVAAMRSAAYETAFGLVYMLTGTLTEVGNEQAERGWGLVDVTLTGDDETIGSLRTFEGLYESLLGADPSGREGRDFLG